MSFLLYEDKMSSACRMCRTVPGTDEVLKTASWYFAVTARHDGKCPGCGVRIGGSKSQFDHLNSRPMNFENVMSTSKSVSHL